MLFYIFYRKYFWKKVENQEFEKMYVDLFVSYFLEDVFIIFVVFRVDKFVFIFCFNYYEEYNYVKFVIQLIFVLEKLGVMISIIW